MTNRDSRITFTLSIIASILLVGAVSAFGVEKLEINVSRDHRYLAYRLDTLRTILDGDQGLGRSTPVKVARAACHPSDTILLALTKTMTKEGTPAGVGFIPHPGTTTLAEKPFYLQLGGFLVTSERPGAAPVVVGTGVRNDSVFVYSVSLDNERPLLRPLCALVELSGQAGWNGSLQPLYDGDYDFDGVTEVVLLVNGGRDGPRRLFSVEVDSLKTEWELTLSSPISDPWILDCRDPTSPGILFSTYANANGFSDSLFSDAHSYLVRVNQRGAVELRYVIGNFAESCRLVRAGSDSTFFLSCHDFTPAEAFVEGRSDRHRRLLRIDHRGRVLNCYEEPEFDGSYLWTGDFEEDGQIDLYCRDGQGRVSIFDEQLNLKARSERTTLLDWFGSVEAWPQEGLVFCLIEAGGMGYYNRRLEKIAFSSGGLLQTARYDADSSAVQLMIHNRFGAALVEIRRKNLVDFVGIIYHDYQSYILAGMVGLVLMTFMLNQNRRRARADLNVISKQKAELEQAYKRLEEATEAITRERAKAAAAEQYRVASGQFRHEINNALGAAKMYLASVVGKAGSGGLKRRLEESQAALTLRVTALVESAQATTAADSEAIMAALVSEKEQVTRLLGDLENVVMKGIDRGLGLTERLRRFERIDHDDVLEDLDLVTAVREVVADHSTVLEAKKIAVEIAADCQVRFKCSPELMEILIRNLLDNSIDACSEDKKSKHQITIRLKQTGDRIEISWHDTGAGIKAENLGRIFQPFYTEKPSTGSGLGLSMVQSIVEKYGGTIAVDSQYGQYTQFEIEFKK